MGFWLFLTVLVGGRMLLKAYQTRSWNQSNKQASERERKLLERLEQLEQKVKEGNFAERLAQLEDVVLFGDYELNKKIAALKEQPVKAEQDLSAEAQARY